MTAKGAPARSWVLLERGLDAALIVAALALAVVSLRGVSPAAAPAGIGDLARRVSALERLAQGDGAPDLATRLGAAERAVENSAIALERILEARERGRFGISEPPRVRRLGSHDWRSTLRRGQERDARARWDRLAEDLDLRGEQQDALVMVAVLAGMRREYVEARVRRGELPAEEGRRRSGDLEAWERDEIRSLLSEEQWERYRESGE